jgi:hypothetical protein
MILDPEPTKEPDFQAPFFLLSVPRLTWPEPGPKVAPYGKNTLHH